MEDVKTCFVFQPCKDYALFEKETYNAKGKFLKTEVVMETFPGQKCEDLRNILMKVDQAHICPNNKPPKSKKAVTSPIYKERVTPSPGILVYHSINFSPRLWRS